MKDFEQYIINRLQEVKENARRITTRQEFEFVNGQLHEIETLMQQDFYEQTWREKDIERLRQEIYELKLYPWSIYE